MEVVGFVGPSVVAKCGGGLEALIKCHEPSEHGEREVGAAAAARVGPAEGTQEAGHMGRKD